MALPKVSQESIYDLAKELGKRLRALRFTRKTKYGNEDYTQKNIGAALHISQPALSRYESGERTIDILQLKQFTELYRDYGVTSDRLLGLPDPTPLQKQKRNASVYTGLSESSIDFIRSLNADQKGMLDQILSGHQAEFTEILSIIVEANEQRDNMEAIEDEFLEWQRELVYYDHVCREALNEDAALFQEVASSENYERLVRVCRMLRLSYPQLFLPAIDQDNCLKKAESRFNSMLEHIIRSARSGILSKGSQYADMMVNASLYGDALEANAAQDFDYFEDPDSLIQDNEGNLHFNFPIDDFYEKNPNAVEEYEKEAVRHIARIGNEDASEFQQNDWKRIMDNVNRLADE